MDDDEAREFRQAPAGGTRARQLRLVSSTPPAATRRRDAAATTSADALGWLCRHEEPTSGPMAPISTPNLDNTDQAAVWHLRNALNVAALGCDLEGGGVIEPYNAG
ncbi:hypothetical protein AB5I41_10370 [Sphingomonas sp. MMS24-JH45]